MKKFAFYALILIMMSIVATSALPNNYDHRDRHHEDDYNLQAQFGVSGSRYHHGDTRHGYDRHNQGYDSHRHGYDDYGHGDIDPRYYHHHDYHRGRHEHDYYYHHRRYDHRSDPTVVIVKSHPIRQN